MSWYIHPSKQLREDELPEELVVTNGNGSIEQAYIPYKGEDHIHPIDGFTRNEIVNNMLHERDELIAGLCRLVQIAFRCQSGYCDGCPMESPYNTSIGGVPECRFEREAIRLGVDVDVWNKE